MKRLLPALALVLAACQTNTSDTPRAPEQLVQECIASDLIDQCPPGSSPTLEAGVVSSCQGQADVEVMDTEGAVTGLCQRAGQCLLVCNFADPCTCGVESITSSEGVVCTDCAGFAACGNNICENGETPEACPEDCGPRCQPGTEDQNPEQRCDGETRQVCLDNGQWSALACRQDQTCAPLEGDARRTYCQTRISPSGGTLPEEGLGTRTGVTGVGADLRFAQADLPASCPWEIFNTPQFAQLSYSPDGQLWLASDTRIWRVDEDACVEVALASEPLWAFAHPYGLTNTLRGQPIWNIQTQARQSIEVFVQDDYVEAAFLTMALSPATDEYTAAFSVQGQSMLASWSLEDGALLRLLRYVNADAPTLSTTRAQAMAYSLNGQILAEARDETALLWNLSQQRYLYLLRMDQRIEGMQFAQHGQDWLLLWGRSQVVLWDVRASRALWSTVVPLEDTRNKVHAALSPDGSVVVVATGAGYRDATGTQVIDSTTGEIVRSFQAQGQVLFSPSGETLSVGQQRFGATF